ncbi:MAG: cyclophilin-like fold protein [Pyrodictiaceae archaeon]
MLLEILDKDKGSSFIVKLYRDLEEWRRVIPFEAELSVWKEEVYFSTPVKLEFKPKELIHRVQAGHVYYWPPGKAMCLFYGLSEAYTPVAPIGLFIGPLANLRTVESGDKAIVKEHIIYKEYSKIVDELTKRGYLVGTPLSEDSRIIVASKYIGKHRLSFNMYIEDYGYHVETDSIIPYLGDYSSIAILRRLKELLKSTRLLRADVSEDNFIVVTSGVYDLDELWEAMEELERYYPLVLEEIFKTN